MVRIHLREHPARPSLLTKLFILELGRRIGTRMHALLELRSRA
jgi:hypothetical protein